MKTRFEKLEEKRGLFSHEELRKLVHELVLDIIKTDSFLISVTKKKVGYGTWGSVGFANDYYFGNNLSELMSIALTGRITHDEDFEFSVLDFSENIEDALFDYLY